MAKTTDEELLTIGDLPGGGKLITIKLADGRLLDVFPDSGTCQVYTADAKQGYQFAMPTWTDEEANELNTDSLEVSKL